MIELVSIVIGTIQRRMGSIDRIAPLFILGLACGFLGWAIVVLTSRIEHRHRERHADGGLTQPNPRLRLLRSRRGILGGAAKGRS